ncbi:1-acyl-sn-glycerol-3-phosphate acyltransferase [Candidatus Woesearchaeota archaeon]|nr:1-acyl-sn-glycerol-3-phosphate acyltransferase [Candidatus Woesearchaeota archaeon]
MAYPLSRYVFGAILTLWLREVRGKEHIPQGKPFIVCPNHSSYLDDVIVPLIISKATNKKVHNYVNRNYFKIPILGTLLLRWGGSIPVEVGEAPDKQAVNAKAFETALHHLSRGGVVGVFPEGHRSRDGELQKAKWGAARLALASKVPVLPIGITGASEALPKGKKFPKLKRCISVSIGKPLELKKYSGMQDDTKILAAATREIMHAVAALAGKKYMH